MKKELALLKKKSEALRKRSEKTKELFEEFENIFVILMSKYFPFPSKNSEKAAAFLIKVNCELIDLAIETEKAYAIYLQMRGEKDSNKSSAIYHKYWKEKVEKPNLLKPGKMLDEKVMKFARACSAKWRKTGRKYFPYLFVSRDNLPYGLHYYTKFIYLGKCAERITR